MPRKQEIWQPSSDTVAAMPKHVNGNTWNGVGESEVRRPKPFFWHAPHLHEWGEMQDYTLTIMHFDPDEGPPIAEAFQLGEEPGTFR